MERLRIRADEVRVGDQFVELDHPFHLSPVTTIATDGGAIEVWIMADEYYQTSSPTLTLDPSEKVEVWR